MFQTIKIAVHVYRNYTFQNTAKTIIISENSEILRRFSDVSLSEISCLESKFPDFSLTCKQFHFPDIFPERGNPAFTREQEHSVVWEFRCQCIMHHIVSRELIERGLLFHLDRFSTTKNSLMTIMRFLFKSKL